MRAVTTRTAAIALGVSNRELDNIISRYPIRGIAKGKQGRSRRLTPESVEQVAIAIALSRDYAVPISAALSIADELLGRDTGAVLSSSGDFTIHADVQKLRRRLHASLTDAIDQIIPPRRGRPVRRS